MNVGRMLRMARHVKPSQILAQLRHAVSGGVRPVVWSGPTPPLRIAEAAAPFLPAPPHAHFDGFRRIEVVGRPVVFRDGIEWDHLDEGLLWSYHLHEHHYARRSGVTPEARAALMLDWIAHHPAGNGWDPHPLALRILSWGKLLLTPGALCLTDEAREQVLVSLAGQVQTLSQNLEVRLQANHLFTNLVGVVFGGLLFGGAAAAGWRRFEAPLARQIEEQIGRDGAHYERSPMYHSLILEGLLDVLNLARAVGSDASEIKATLSEAAGAMLAALDVMTHPDGEIALIGDAAFGIAHPPSALRDYASSLGVQAKARGRADVGVLDAVGLVRLSAGKFHAVISAGGVMPAYQPGHSQCDALSFELSIGRERLVTDTGVTEYLPGPLRDASRATRSHSTIEIAGEEQAEMWGGHRVGGRPDVGIEDVEPGRRLLAWCAGWSTRKSVHRRTFDLTEDGLEIYDAIEGSAPSARLTLPLSPGLRPLLQGSVASVELPSGARVVIELPEGPGLVWRVATQPYFPAFGTRQDRACLVGEAAQFISGVWRIRIGSL